MNLILSQDQEIFQVTKVWYKAKYYRRNWWSKRMWVGINLYGRELNGDKVLLGTFSDKSEVEYELHLLNESNDTIKHISVY